jgi:hypothetical protein
VTKLEHARRPDSHACVFSSQYEREHYREAFKDLAHDSSLWALSVQTPVPSMEEYYENDSTSGENRDSAGGDDSDSDTPSRRASLIRALTRTNSERTLSRLGATPGSSRNIGGEIGFAADVPPLTPSAMGPLAKVV